MDSDHITAFQDVTAATTRALADKSEIELSFKVGGQGGAGREVTLPRPSRLAPGTEINRLRGQADQAAVRLRYHDDKIDERNRPADPSARKLFDELELARCDCLGALRFAGVAKNLDAHLRHRYSQQALAADPASHPEDLPAALGRLGREVLGEFSGSQEQHRVMDAWRKALAPAVKDLQAMSDCLDDQEAYARQCRALLKKLGYPDRSAEDERREDQEDSPEGQSNAVSDTMQASQELGDEMLNQEEVESTGEENLESEAQTGEDSQHDPDSESELSKSAPTIDTPGGRGETAQYRIYTTEYDEVVEAIGLCEREELVRLRAQLDDHLGNLNNVIGRLANRLQRRLLAKQSRSWQFNLEEGTLDSARLSRVIIDPLHSLSFKRESETEFRDTVVTCLIDNSGSMRGRPIQLAAITADMLARTLERCGVKVEILGFTTRAWKGGRARERWLAAGKPAQPGRLNDLRHIIYKSADMPWRRARQGLGLMLREGLLKENIDGEALAWAYARLAVRPEQRKILLVISDGAPVDDATLSANSGIFLETHLRDMIAEIESSNMVELSAIGIGHDVTRYYARALTLVDAGQLGGAVMEELADLFDPTPKGPRRCRSIQ